jgi:NADH:ubiquinone oxidoreductase subunit 6 (subunit J)
VTTDAWSSLLFYIVSIAGIAAGLKMVTEANMVRSALSLVLALASVAVIFLLLSADFLAMVQILLYVGAIMILMLFAIMLTPSRPGLAEPVELPGLADRGQHIAAAAVALAVGVITTAALLAHPWNQRPWPLNAPTTELLGTLMMTNFVLPFEIASVLLTAGLIGAIVIARED